MANGIIYDALEVAVAYYNSTKATNYTLSDLSFGNPQDLRAVGCPHPSGKNTLVVATVKSTGATINLVYDRYDLANFYRDGATKWSTFPHFYLWKDCVGTKDTLAGCIKYHYGIPFTARDIVAEKFYPEQFTDDVIRNVDVKISDLSYTYLPGSTMTIGVAGAYKLIDGVLYCTKDSTLSGPSQWTEDWASVSQTIAAWANTALMTMGIDYSKASRCLRRWTGFSTWQVGIQWGYYPQGTWLPDQMTMLCKLLTKIDGYPWTFDSSGKKPFNLYYAWPVFLGKTSKATRDNTMKDRCPTQYQHLLNCVNPKYDYVLIVRLNENYQSNCMSSCAIFHFNL